MAAWLDVGFSVERMGTMIHLSVGNLEIDWGKNHGFTNHSALFQPSDLTKVPYRYAKDGSEDVDAEGRRNWDLVTEMKDGLSSPLSRVVDRIRLLGHTRETARKEFEHLWQMTSDDPPAISFEVLAAALREVNVTKLNEQYDRDFGEFFRSELAERLGLDTALKKAGLARWEIGQSMENLTAYSILTLLAENPSAKDLPVIWHFKDHEESGWAKWSDYVRTLDAENRFLIVTEGSSDALIVKKAFELLMPHVADFFHYVDAPRRLVVSSRLVGRATRKTGHPEALILFSAGYVANKSGDSAAGMSGSPSKNSRAAA